MVTVQSAGGFMGSVVKVKTGYKPRPLQVTVHKDKARFKVIVAHRRFGKTTLAINELIKEALLHPNSRYWYVAPTYRQAKTVAWTMVQQYLPTEFIVKKSEQDLTLKLFNGAELALKGAENKDALRGVGLNGLVLDEYELMERDVWEAILQPTLMENQGWAIFIGTPKGRNHFFELYKKGDGTNKHWKSYHFNAEETGILPKEDLAINKAELPESTYREEYLAEFLEGEGTVFRGIKDIVAPLSQCYAEPQYDKRYQIGVDIARLMDYTVLTVVDNNLKVVHFERFNKVDWEYQKLKIVALAERYGHARVIIDATGQGDPIANDLQGMGQHVLPYKINSNVQKRTLIDNLKLRIEQKECTIPNEPILLKELEAFTFKMTDAGNITYGAPNGFHDDCVISLALAVWDTVPKPQGRHQGDRFAPYEDDY